MLRAGLAGGCVMPLGTREGMGGDHGAQRDGADPAKRDGGRGDEPFAPTGPGSRNPQESPAASGWGAPPDISMPGAVRARANPGQHRATGTFPVAIRLRQIDPPEPAPAPVADTVRHSAMPQRTSAKDAPPPRGYRSRETGHARRISPEQQALVTRAVPAATVVDDVRQETSTNLKAISGTWEKPTRIIPVTVVSAPERPSALLPAYAPSSRQRPMVMAASLLLMLAVSLTGVLAFRPLLGHQAPTGPMRLHALALAGNPAVQGAIPAGPWDSLSGDAATLGLGGGAAPGVDAPGSAGYPVNSSPSGTANSSASTANTSAPSQSKSPDSTSASTVAPAATATPHSTTSTTTHSSPSTSTSAVPAAKPTAVPTNSPVPTPVPTRAPNPTPVPTKAPAPTPVPTKAPEPNISPAPLSPWPPADQFSVYPPGRSSFGVSYPSDGYYGKSFGQCTWWAQNERRDENLQGMGNARYWAGNAVGRGYRVDSTPAPNATVVFQPGIQGAGGAGHVAHVIAVYPDGWFLISEMNFYWNGGGWGRVDYRYAHTGSGVQFIH